MLGKSAKPVIEILTQSLVFCGRSSSRGIKKPCDFGGVGFGVVEKSSSATGIPPNTATATATALFSHGIATRDRKGDGNSGSVFHISPPMLGAEATGIPPPDFLSSCHLCRKKLHGKDIYMYRGEKAFCSTECRYMQMVVDERTYKCTPEMAVACTLPEMEFCHA